MSQDSDGQFLLVLQRLILAQIRHAILDVPLDGVVRGDNDFKLGRAAVRTDRGHQPALLSGGALLLFLEQAQDGLFSYQAQPVPSLLGPGVRLGELGEKLVDRSQGRLGQFSLQFLGAKTGYFRNEGHEYGGDAADNNRIADEMTCCSFE